MSSWTWGELGQLLSALIEQPAAERAAFLDRACGDRRELREELVALAEAHERSGLLDSPAAALFHSVAQGPTTPVTGTVLHYRLVERLGQGGMGVVYLARDLRLGRTVALKFLPAHLGFDPAAKERLWAEAQAAAALDHLNICTIHEINEAADGQLFIAMPYYKGETLKARLTRGPLAPLDAVGLASQAAQGLAKAHQRGVIHRDIKPANLMITRDGVLKILDFGVAKVSGLPSTIPGARLGTIEYMSPEQVDDDALDGRTDIWSLGVVLYEMLTGARPFQGANRFAVMHAILSHRPPPASAQRSEIPPPVDRVLARMLARAPADRYLAGELVRDVEQLRQQLTGGGAARAGTFDEPPEILPGGERRQLTILVTSVVDHERLANEPLEELRILAEEIVQRHGGVLNQFTGESLVALFGAPATHEDDPARAVRAAFELHRSTAGQPALRSAIHTGLVAVQLSGEPEQAYRVSGSVAQWVVLLAGLTPGNQIWVSPDCRRAIAASFDTRPVGPMLLSPDRPPVVPFRVVGVTETRGRLEAMERGRLTAFTGRDREMRALREALGSAAAGTGRFVTVVGDAGVGKSRLLLEFRRELESSDVALLQGHCDSSESTTPYLPFVEAMRGWLQLGRTERVPLDAAGTAALLRSLGSELEENLPLYLHLLALPDPAYPVPRHLHGEHYRLAMQEALAAFVTLAARRRPAVLLLEDWHWADEASNGVLQQIAELAVGFPLLVVVTCRGPRPSLYRGWADPGNHPILALEPLDSGSSGAMLQSILRVNQVPPRLVELIHERTGGNPFFLEEITQTLLEEGALDVEDGEAVLAGPLDALQLPDTVQGVLRARLDRLDRGTREVLRLAAVVGREFARGVLEHAIDPARLPHALQVLKAAGVIRQVRVVPEPAYRFKHVLTQEAAVGSLLEHQRKELHGKVGEAIEAVYGDTLEEHYARLTDHFSRAEHWSKAVQYGLCAAERSNALSEFAESLEILERCQDWLPRLQDSPERRQALIDILFRQERLCETLGLRGRQQRIIDELVALLEFAGWPAQLAEAYQRQGDLSTLLRRFDEAETELHRALEIRRGLNDVLGERNLLRSLGLLRWYQGRDAEALRCIEAALDIDREREDLEGQVGDLANLGNVLKGMGEPERARITLEEALRLSEVLEAGTPHTVVADLSCKRAYILQNLANVHRELGDEDRALHYLTQCRTLTIGKRLPIQLSYPFTSMAHLYLRNGRVEECLSLYREAVELTRKANFAPGLAHALRFLGEVLLGLGRDREAIAPLVEAAELFAQLRDPVTERLLWTEVATLHERRSEFKEALAAWGKARALHDQAGDEAQKLEVLEGLARVARRYLPEPSLALGYYGEALVLAQRLGDPARAARLRNAMGIIEWELGRFDEARRHYEEGLRLVRALGDAEKTAHLLASLGVTLDAMGRRVEARRCLEEARTLYREPRDLAGEARTLGALTEVLTRLGDVEHAIECGEAALRLRRARGDHAGEGWALHRLALAYLADGSADQAREHAAAAARLAEERGDADLAAACRDATQLAGR